MLRNSTSKQRREDDLDDEYEEDNDEESALGFDDISKFDPENKERKKQLEIMARLDEEYEGEWGYALIKALRGKTVGRRLRRKLFKFGFIQLTCGFAMFIIAIQQTDNMRNVENFSEPLFGGASLTSLTWCVGLPSFVFGMATMTMVWHWASVVTNRRLLSNIMRIYVFLGIVLFIMSIWCCSVLFLTYRTVKNWNQNAVVASSLAYYICEIIFLLPLIIVYFLYTLDVSYLTDEVEKGGQIAEANPPEDAKDLSDVTLIQSCVFVCAMPCIFCIQISDLGFALKRAYDRTYRDEPLCKLPSCCLRDKTALAEEKQAQQKKAKRRTLWRRIWRTLVRCFKGSKPKTAVQPIEITSLPLRELEKDRETDEREKREKIYRDQEEERQRIALKEAEATAEFLRKQEKEMEENARRLEEQRLADLKALEEQKEAEEFANRWESVMNVARFKELWASLPTNGSFQCYLKTMPTVNGLTDHMKKQGFHVVFAVNPNAANIEVGICNIRPVGQEPWFMARFLVSNNSFSAVMKSNSPEIVPGFVKKFALAKVLKIDNAAKP